MALYKNANDNFNNVTGLANSPLFCSTYDSYVYVQERKAKYNQIHGFVFHHAKLLENFRLIFNWISIFGFEKNNTDSDRKLLFFLLTRKETRPLI